MRYIVYGAGAIGGVIGACLFEQGREVVLIARGAHLAAMRQQGLRAVFPGREFVQQIPVAGHPSEIEFREGDAVLLCMKTQDTAEALEALEACAGSDLPVFCVQNGIENERLAARRFAHVYAVNNLMWTTFLDPGVVTCSSTSTNGVLDVGCFPRGVDALAGAVSADFNAAGLDSRVTNDIMRWKYAKLLRNAGSGLQVSCGLGVDTGDLREQIEAEALRVYEAAGVTYVPADEYNQRARLAQPARHGGGSSWQSIARGTGSVETDYLNGEIVLLGRLHGVPAPVNEAVRRLANRVARERLQPGAITPEQVRQLAASLAG
jgi:2-dehydropantoate 2-reductase